MSSNKLAIRVFTFLLFTGALLVAAESHGAGQKHRASLSVDHKASMDRDQQSITKTLKSGAEETTTTKTETETCTLEIDVKNSGKQSGTFRVEWYFIAEQIKKGAEDQRIISHPGAKEITLDAKQTGQEIVSTEFVVTDKVIDTISADWDSSKQTVSGEIYEGYIVLVKVGDEIIAQESNSSRYLKDKWLKLCEQAAK